MNDFNKLVLSVKRTQLEMMRDRGYDIPDFELPILDPKAGILTLKAVYGESYEKLNQVYEKGNKRTSVWYPNEFGLLQANPMIFAPTNIVMYNNFTTDIEMNKRDIGEDEIYECAIIVTGASPVNNILKRMKDHNSFSSPVLQMYSLFELMFNPTKHVYVPKHRLLTLVELDLFYTKSSKSLIDPRIPGNRNKNMLPVLTVKHIPPEDPNEDAGDPIAKYYFSKKGDVFEITRVNIYDDHMLPGEIIYRYVV
jgi:DNA-directed RNA polymerase subunit H (RpoH/RPB5)